MVRICPVPGSRDTSESMSFLKVDGHKKQLTLLEPPPNTPSTSAAAQRRSASAPKMFAFDAIFTQDASQVSAEGSCGSLDQTRGSPLGKKIVQAVLKTQKPSIEVR